jgi:hypothetical protein
VKKTRSASATVTMMWLATEVVRDEHDDVGHQQEHEEREHQREEPHSAFADRVVDGVGNELIG